MQCIHRPLQKIRITLPNLPPRARLKGGGKEWHYPFIGSIRKKLYHTRRTYNPFLWEFIFKKIYFIFYPNIKMVNIIENNYFVINAGYFENYFICNSNASQ
ncbi:hypothetical protein KL86DPRO_10216 [uncultured delta proteobacterium]|uniref:Uncharacterized protein n=1 Tax=uncultured delta proteobacterium TaxID=34034 RepID=A0A212IWN8_9DELT|nr:hypothetical protein KL86DPRO_10216 [uncultured delta proteobacterium]